MLLFTKETIHFNIYVTGNGYMQLSLHSSKLNLRPPRSNPHRRLGLLIQYRSQIIQHISHGRSLGWIVGPHPFHELDNLPSPVFAEDRGSGSVGDEAKAGRETQMSIDPLILSLYFASSLTSGASDQQHRRSSARSCLPKGIESAKLERSISGTAFLASRSFIHSHSSNAIHEASPKTPFHN